MTIAMTMAMAYCGSMLLAKVVNTYQYTMKGQDNKSEKRSKI